MPSFSVYFKDEQAVTAERFKQIMRREGTNVSKHLWGYIVSYVEIHDPGNPQSRMTSFVDGGTYDIGALEGEIRQIFYSRAKKGIDVNMRDIISVCKAHLDNINKVLAMAERIYTWLKLQGVKAWR